MVDNEGKKEKSTFDWTIEEENLEKYPRLYDTEDKSYKDRHKCQKAIDGLASLGGGGASMHLTLVTVGLMP